MGSILKNIITFAIVLAVSLSAIDIAKLEANSKMSVSMFPYSSDYRKDRKVLRDFSVNIMNTAFLNLIKYEKTYSALNKKNIDINALNVDNVVGEVVDFPSTIIILPTIAISTNISIQIDKDIVDKEIEARIAEEEASRASSISIEIDEEIEDTLGVGGVESMESGSIETNVVENIEVDISNEAENRGTNDYNIINPQLLEYISHFDDTNFITNIDSLNDSVFLTTINSITSTNALIFTTNTTKMYNFDVLDTQTTNILYSTSISNTNQILTVSRDAIKSMEYHFASKLLIDIAQNSRSARDSSAVAFWVERKASSNRNGRALDNANLDDTSTEKKESWTDNRTPIFAISSSKKDAEPNSFTNNITNTANNNARQTVDDGFERVEFASDDNIAVFDVGDSIRFNFELHDEGFVNILYVSPSSTNMSLLYPNNYNMGYATNNNTILSNGLYQVPTEANNMELVLNQVGVSRVYLIYSSSQKAMYDLTKFNNGGFLSVKDEIDFVWHLESIFEKNVKNNTYFVEEITIEVVDSDNLGEVVLPN